MLAEKNICVLSKMIPFDKYHHSLTQTFLAAVSLVPFKDNQDQVSVIWNWSQKSSRQFFKAFFFLMIFGRVEM